MSPALTVRVSLLVTAVPVSGFFFESFKPRTTLAMPPVWHAEWLEPTEIKPKRPPLDPEQALRKELKRRYTPYETIFVFKAGQAKGCYKINNRTGDKKVPCDDRVGAGAANGYEKGGGEDQDAIHVAQLVYFESQQEKLDFLEELGLPVQ